MLHKYTTVQNAYGHMIAHTTSGYFVNMTVVPSDPQANQLSMPDAVE